MCAPLKSGRKGDAGIPPTAILHGAVADCETCWCIVNGEEDIGNLATEFSEGIEKRTRGIVGPVPIESSHPKLTELLKKSKVGEIQKPIQIDNSFVVIRVESHEPVVLDEFTRKKMGEELVKIWLKTKVNEMMNKLIDKTESSLIV